MATRSLNCTILWEIENFHFDFDSLLKRTFSDMCVPTAEVETFNSEKWKLELHFRETENLEFETTLKILKLHGDLDMPIEKRASIVNKSGNATSYVIKPQSVSEILFGFHCQYRNIVQDGCMSLKIELEFLVDDLALCTTVRTVVKTETRSFDWSLKGISEEYGTPEYPLRVHLPGSPEFALFFHLDTFYTLQLKSGNIVNSYSLPAITSGDSHSPPQCNYIYVSYLIQGNINNIKIHSKGVNFFDKRTSIPKLLNASLILFPKTIDLKCQFSFSDGTCESIQSETVFSSLNSENSVLTEKFHAGESLFKNMNFSDVILKAGSKEFKAHRSVLSSVSPVFNAMFENEMSETVTGVVGIDDMEPKTLKKMLKFVYTGETGDWSFDQHEKLLAAAHKYSIPLLTDVCSRRLVSMTTAQNVVRVLHLGYLYNDGRMKSAAKSLFSEMPWLILRSKEWEDYMGDCFPPSEAGHSFSIDKLKKSLETVKEKSSSLVPPSVSALFKKDEEDPKEG